MQVYNSAFVDADFAHGTALAFLVALATGVFALISLLASRRSAA
jgi:ABC-type sugar transport system permease subunit